MAEKPKPQASIPIPADVLAEMGNLSGAVTQVKRQIADVRREIKNASREGRVVDAGMVTRLGRLENLKFQIEGVKKRELQVKRDIQDTKKTGNALRFVFGAQAFRGLLQGNILDPGQIAGLAFGLQGVLDRNAARIFGAGSRITRGIKMFSAAAPILGEAVSSVMAAWQSVQRQDSAAKTVGAMFGRREISQEEFDIFKRAEGTHAFSLFGFTVGSGGVYEDPIQALKDAQSGAAAFRKLPPDTVGEIFKGVFREKNVKNLFSVFSGAADEGFKRQLKASEIAAGMRFDGLKKSIEGRVAAEEKRLGRRLTASEREQDERAGFAAFLKSISVESAKELTDALNKSLDNDKKAIPLRKTQSELWKEAEKKIQEDIATARAKSRIALSGSVGYR